MWIKRDDLTGSGLTGNKVRKLERLIVDARKKGADTLVTCGGVQSNHCRATALSAARVGMGCRLLLRGEPPPELDGNLLLDRIAGAKLEFISPERYYVDLQGELERVADQVTVEGGKPYIIPEGGSNAIGAWGYVEAAGEAFDQCRMIGVQPKRIIIAAGSGGTHAGLWIGAKLRGWECDIVSVTVCYDLVKVTGIIYKIISDMIKTYELDLECSPQDVIVLDKYRGPGYAEAGPEIYRAIIEVARAEGVVTDPVYTGKAAWGMLEELKAGRLTGTTLFWHTGGIFGLFPLRGEILAGEVH